VYVIQALVAAGLALAGLGLGFSGPRQALEAVQAQAVVWPGVTLEQVGSGFVNPVHITHAGDDRLFVVQQSGEVYILLNGVKMSVPFLDIHTRVSCCGERGLLSLAFPPGYAQKGYFYANYTDLNGDTVVSRFSLTADVNLADAGSEVVVLSVPQPFANHNGGQLAFGPDGYLYIGIGDGGSGGDPGNRAQDPAELLGKLLRIDVEGSGCVTDPPDTPRNYCIPADNPFVGSGNYQPEIWAEGLRNPWRFSFDRVTGDLYTADVGQGSREEVDFQPASSPGGENYGWNILEGSLCYPSLMTGCTPPARYSSPVAEYDHGAGPLSGCSIIGGFVFRGPTYRMTGVYIYGDLCTGKIYGLQNDGAWQSALLTTAPFSISSFGEDASGLLYVADYSSGGIYLLTSEVDLAQLTQKAYFPLMF
jgi:glucose/arabinose dehydrogenase